MVSSGVFFAVMLLVGIILYVAGTVITELVDRGIITADRMKKVAVIAFFVAFLFVGYLAGSSAETFDKVLLGRDDFVGFDIVEFDGETCYRVDFTYEGEILSWINTISGFDPTADYEVLILDGEHVIDAEPLRKGGEEVNAICLN